MRRARIAVEPRRTAKSAKPEAAVKNVARTERVARLARRFAVQVSARKRSAGDMKTGRRARGAVEGAKSAKLQGRETVQAPSPGWHGRSNGEQGGTVSAGSKPALGSSRSSRASCSEIETGRAGRSGRILQDVRV